MHVSFLNNLRFKGTLNVYICTVYMCTFRDIPYIYPLNWKYSSTSIQSVNVLAFCGILDKMHNIFN